MEHMDEEILKQKKLLRQQEEKRSSAESMEQEAGESIYDEVALVSGARGWRSGVGSRMEMAGKNKC